MIIDSLPLYINLIDFRKKLLWRTNKR